MPASLTVRAGVLVRADPERVWELAVDWARQREWVWATRTRGGHGVGAAVVGRTGVGPIGFTDPMVITTWDPPRRCVVTHTGKIVRGQGEFEVRPRGDSAELVWTERIVLPWRCSPGGATPRNPPPLCWPGGATPRNPPPLCWPGGATPGTPQTNPLDGRYRRRSAGSPAPSSDR